MSTLNKRADEFIAAGRKLRAKIVSVCCRELKDASGEDETYDDILVETVNASSAFQILCSHTLLAYSTVLVRKNQTGSKGIHSPNPTLDASGSGKVRPRPAICSSITKIKSGMRI